MAVTPCGRCRAHHASAGGRTALLGSSQPPACTTHAGPNHAMPSCAACGTCEAGRAARTSALSRPAAVSAATSAGMPWRSVRSTSKGTLRMPLPLLSAAALLTSGLRGPEQAQARAGTQARQGRLTCRTHACHAHDIHGLRARWMQDLTISAHSPLSLSWERRHVLGARASKARARPQRERTGTRPGCRR